MATDRDVNINIKTTSNAKGLKNVSKELSKLDKATNQAEKSEKALRLEAEKLEKTNKKLSKGLEMEADKLAKLSKEAKKTAAAEEKLAKSQAKVNSTTGKTTKATGKATKANINMGRSTLLASQAYEDLQFGMMGVLNNIPMLVMSLGGTAGLAGIISIAAVAASSLNGAFDTSKEAIADFTEALDKINTQNLEDFKAATSDAEATEAFTKAINAQNTAISNNTQVLDKNIAKQQDARKIRLEVAKAETNLELAEIDASGAPASEKARQKNAAKGRLAALSGADKAATLRESVTSLGANKAQALSDAEAARIRSNELNQGLPSAADVISKERSSEGADALRGKSIEKILGFSSSELSDINFGDDPGGREAGGSGVRTDSRIVAGVQSMEKAVKDLEDAMKSGIELSIRTALKGVIGVGAAQQGQLAKDQAIVPQLRQQTEDRNINKVALAAKSALNNLNKTQQFAQEALTLEKKISDDRAESLSEAKRFRDLLIEAEKIGEQQASAQAKLAAFPAIQAANLKAQNIRDTSQVGGLQNNERKAKEVAEKKLAELEAKAAQSRGSAGTTATSKLGLLKTSTGGDSGGLDPFVRAAGDGQTGEEAQALKDYLIGRQTELARTGKASAQTMKILQDLITVSQAQANEAIRNEAALKKMRTQVAALNKNAKTQEK